MPRTRRLPPDQLLSARRAQILDAATAVFAQKGYHRATIKEIAHAANLADGTLYLYFSSKTDLLLGILDRLNETDQRAEQLAQGVSVDFKSFFAAYLRHRLAVLQPTRAMLRAVLPELLVDAELRARYHERVIAPTLALGERYVRAQIDQGRLRPVDAALATRAMAGLVLGLLLLQLLGDESPAAFGDDTPEALAVLLFDGLRPLGSPAEAPEELDPSE
jgi:AcrR family transcriptional regulator